MGVREEQGKVGHDIRPAESAARLDNVQPFRVMRIIEAIAARRAAGAPVVDLAAGQPLTPAPAPVLAAARSALDTDRLGYTEALGLPALRDAIAAHCRNRYDLDINRADIAVTTGSSGGFLLVFLACFEPGDVVVLARPGYPAYRNALAALGCRVVELPTGARFTMTVEQLEALPFTPAGVVLASPANPTGTMLDAHELAAVAQWCDERGVRFVSDEIYHGICYGSPATSAWQTSRNSVVVNSFSKYFSMTGWRLGWLLLPRELVEVVDRLAGNLALCPPALSQRAALAAFDAYDELDANVARYRASRDLLMARLPELGIDSFAPPDGAFYLYADVSRWTHDSVSFAARLLDETGVAVAPGVDFDPIAGRYFVRLSFAGDIVEIERGVRLLGEWLGPGIAS